MSDAFSAILVVILLSSVLGSLRGLAWWFDLFSHFRVQYFLGGAVLACLLLLNEQWAGAAAAAAVSTYNLILIWRQVRPGRSQCPNRPETECLKIVTFNVQYTNQRYAALSDYLDRERPDIVLLQEVTAQWNHELHRLAASFPFCFSFVHPTWRGIAILARTSWTDVRFIDGSDVVETSMIAARFGHATVPFALLAVKTVAPTSAELTFIRNRQLVELGRLANRIDGPVIVTGDFNASAWSSGYASFMRSSGRRWQKLSYLPTWPASAGILGIHIDHIFTSTPFEIVRATTGPRLGSDHRPLVATVRIGANGDGGGR